MARARGWTDRHDPKQNTSFCMHLWRAVNLEFDTLLECLGRRKQEEATEATEATAATAIAATTPATTTRTRAGGRSQDSTARKTCAQ